MLYWLIVLGVDHTQTDGLQQAYEMIATPYTVFQRLFSMFLGAASNQTVCLLNWFVWMDFLRSKKSSFFPNVWLYTDLDRNQQSRQRSDQSSALCSVEFGFSKGAGRDVLKDRVKPLVNNVVFIDQTIFKLVKSRFSLDFSPKIMFGVKCQENRFGAKTHAACSSLF